MRKALEKNLFTFLLVLASFLVFCLAGVLIWGIVLMVHITFPLEGLSILGLPALGFLIMLLIVLGVIAYRLIDSLRWRKRQRRQN